MILNKFNIELSHTKFTIYFTSIMYIVYNSINIDKLTKWFEYNGEINYFGFISYFILGYCLFLIIFTIIAHKYTTKLFSILLVVLSTSVTYFILKYNIALDTSMLLNVIHTDATESLPLISIEMLPYVIFLIVIPVFLISIVKINYNSTFKHTIKTVVIIVISLLIALAMIYISFKELHRAGNLSNKYILYSLVPVNYLAATIDVTKKTIRPYLKGEIQKDKEIIAKVTKEDNLVVVLAIGEAIRQKNLPIYGYSRVNNTPLLSKIKDIHALNGNARLGSTLYALREILKKDKINLTHVTNSAGIDTSCYVNYTLYDNCSVGEVKAVKGKYEKTYDEDVLPLLEKGLSSYNKGYKFITLHLGGGVHGPVYGLRHPKEYNVFLPTCTSPDMLNSCTEEERYNAYDNAILYQDYVLNEIINKLEKLNLPYVFIFVSDHGESLGENGYVFHGMPPGMSLPPEQADVPLLIKSSVPIEIIKKDLYTQPDIYDTVLDLLSIETEEFDKSGSFIKKQFN